MRMAVEPNGVVKDRGPICINTRVIHFSKIIAKDHRINIYYDIYSTHEKYRLL